MVLAELDNLDTAQPAESSSVPLPEAFTFRPDARQRRLIYKVLDHLRAETGFSAVPAIYSACCAYESVMDGDPIADPDRTRRTGEPTAPMVRHFAPHQAATVHAAIEAAISNGCEDADHALTHMLDSYILFDGERGPTGWARIASDLSLKAQSTPYQGLDWGQPE